MSPPAVPLPSASELKPLDPAVVERFRRDVEAAAGGAITPDDRLALAVSGGPDSMALLALAHAALPDRIVAATVDHRLRPQSAQEAAMVAAHCRTHGIPHKILKPRRRIFGASIQASARQVRYGLLGEWALAAGATLLATAHHRDDQIETFLMRARRGSGPGGLSGIRARWIWERHRWHRGYPKGGVVAVADVDALTVIRPLLTWTRASLRDLVQQAGHPFVDDPSNDDAQYDRVKMRALLAENPWLATEGVARSAAICAEIDRDFEAMIDWLRRERMCQSDADSRCYDMAGLPRELRRRLTRDAIGYVRSVGAVTEGQWSDGANIEPLLDSLEAGRVATQAGVMATPRDDIWHFTIAPARRSH